MKNVNQKGDTKILTIVLAVVAVVAVVYWVSQRQSAPYTPPKVSETGIQSADDLMNASDDLDKTNIDNAIDKELSQNDTDAASF